MSSSAPGAGGVLRTARRLTSRDWGTVLEALAFLAFARLAVLMMRFPALATRLGTPMTESTHDDDELWKPVLRRMKWAIGAVSRRAPWRCMCLEQAVAAKMMLRRRGMASTLYFGVARDPGDTSIKAHAWVRCGTCFVTGGEGRDGFAVVSTFAEEATE